MIEKIKDHMEVVGSCGKHVGTVDHLDENDTIKLTKNDPDADGVHHYIPQSWVESVDDVVHLNKDCTTAKSEWMAEKSA